MPGIITSSKIASKPPAASCAEPRLPAAGVHERHALRLQVADEQLGEPGVVVDQEHAHAVIHRHTR